MKQRLFYFVKYYLFWLVLMALQKPVFMLSQRTQLSGVHTADVLQVLLHAFPLDLSVASYMAVFFGLLMALSFWLPSRWIARISAVYTAVLLLLDTVVFCADIGMFPYWGFHLDKTVFVYLATPKEMLANAPWYVWAAAAIAMLALSALCYAGYNRWMRGLEKMPMVEDAARKAGYTLATVLLTGLLFLPLRGSVTTSTMNTGRVYFSENQLLNLSAINPLFNLMESLGENTFDTQRYTYMDSAEAQELVSALLPETPQVEAQESVLATARPDIVLFILESFSQNAWFAMPCLQRLAEEGVYFSRVAASSFRTDRGVVAVMSGFPGQPTSSLMLVPAKSSHLPQLGKSLAAEGYALKFWYGGDEDFTNMRSYLISGGFIDRVNDHSFAVSERLSKWGVPDHVLFPQAADEIRHRTDTTPHLDVLLSLSSHEPFEVPVTDRYHHPYLNSIAYTDSCIGAFADSLRQSSRWNNTLLVFVADHGYPYPEDVLNHEPRRYSIPVVWAGGAVKAHRQVNTLCSQTDVVPTLLAQMGIEHSAYTFSKNVLDSTAVPFAFYSFNDGFALLTERDTIVVDAKADKLVMGKDAEVSRQAHAFMQRVMETIEEW